MLYTELCRILPKFEEAAKKLGWERYSYTQYHERDDRQWQEVAWKNAAGQFLFDEDDLTEALALEIIRLAERLPDNG